MTTLESRDIALRFITEETAAGGLHPGGLPFGGLKLTHFRGARDALKRAGLVEQSPSGRWVPVKP